MSIVNFNHHVQGYNTQDVSKSMRKENDTNCFQDDDWIGNAANAVGEAFDNVDDFSELFKGYSGTNDTR